MVHELSLGTVFYLYQCINQTFNDWVGFTDAQDLPPEIDPRVFVTLQDKVLRDSCPNGVVSCECDAAPGTNVSENLFMDDGFLNALLTYAGCNPGLCTCKGDPNYEVNIRPPQLKAVLRVCPDGEMDRCLCEDKSKIEYPWTLVDMMLCKPKRAS